MPKRLSFLSCRSSFVTWERYVGYLWRFLHLQRPLAISVHSSEIHCAQQLALLWAFSMMLNNITEVWCLESKDSKDFYIRNVLFSRASLILFLNAALLLQTCKAERFQVYPALVPVVFCEHRNEVVPVHDACRKGSRSANALRTWEYSYGEAHLQGLHTVHDQVETWITLVVSISKDSKMTVTDNRIIVLKWN